MSALLRLSTFVHYPRCCLAQWFWRSVHLIGNNLHASTVVLYCVYYCVYYTQGQYHCTCMQHVANQVVLPLCVLHTRAVPLCGAMLWYTTEGLAVDNLLPVSLN
jgi:hypothetical protein